MHQHHAANCLCQHNDLQLSSQTKQKQLLTALVLIGGFAGVEFAVGLSSHSLALVAESGHLGADCLALLLAFLASRVAQAPPNWGWLGNSNSLLVKERTLETWAALINSIGLAVVALLIGWEAFSRLQVQTVEIASQPMLITALVGLLINGINIALLHRGSEHDLNIKAAFLHVVADALGAIGVILAAIAVSAYHWLWADGAISLAIAGLILASAIPLIKQSLQRLQNASKFEVFNLKL